MADMNERLEAEAGTGEDVFQRLEKETGITRGELEAVNISTELRAELAQALLTSTVVEEKNVDIWTFAAGLAHEKPRDVEFYYRELMNIVERTDHYTEVMMPHMIKQRFGLNRR